jgi:tRNA1(Val) A37 N6-methylase TrmN6
LAQRGIVQVPGDDNESGQSEKYQATPPEIFQQIMEALQLIPKGFLFFDMGCGKGRVLLLASAYPFQRIFGVELQSELATMARQNICGGRFVGKQCDQIEVIECNAAEFVFPDQNAVVYFYNPFKEETMRRVIENVRRSALVTKQRYILYLNPVLAASVLEEPGQFALVASKPRFAIYKMLFPEEDLQNSGR